MILFLSIIAVVAAVSIYLLPSIIGWNKKDVNGIIAVNLFLGWTLIGWVTALVWSLASPKKPTEWHYICPKCEYKNTLNQVVKVYVCPQCKTETPIDEFELS